MHVINCKDLCTIVIVLLSITSLIADDSKTIPVLALSQQSFSKYPGYTQNRLKFKDWKANIPKTASILDNNIEAIELSSGMIKFEIKDDDLEKSLHALTIDILKSEKQIINLTIDHYRHNIRSNNTKSELLLWSKFCQKTNIKTMSLVISRCDEIVEDDIIDLYNYVSRVTNSKVKLLIEIGYIQSFVEMMEFGKTIASIRAKQPDLMVVLSLDRVGYEQLESVTDFCKAGGHDIKNLDMAGVNGIRLPSRGFGTINTRLCDFEKEEHHKLIKDIGKVKFISVVCLGQQSVLSDNSSYLERMRPGIDDSMRFFTSELIRP